MSVLLSAAFPLLDPHDVMVLEVDLLVNGIVVELLVLDSVLEWLQVIRLVEDIGHTNSHLDVLAREHATHYRDSDRALNGLDYV